jgi:hypothetical protein
MHYLNTYKYCMLNQVPATQGAGGGKICYRSKNSKKIASSGTAALSF